MTEKFPRTACNCPLCAEQCYHVPGMLGIGDLEQIIRRLAPEAKIDELPGIMAENFRASPGAKCGRLRANGTVEIFRIPTIVPASNNTGKCKFLQKNGLCNIHDIAPAGCRYFEPHMDAAEGHRRSVEIHAEIMNDENYRDAWQWLAMNNLATTAPETKRANMKSAIEKN